jgi:hypothetical protein
MSETIVVNTPEGIEHWRVASAIAMLRLEVSTGMKATRYSVLKACKVNWGCPKQTKKGALEWMENLYEKTYGFPYGGGR